MKSSAKFVFGMEMLWNQNLRKKKRKFELHCFLKISKDYFVSRQCQTALK